MDAYKHTYVIVDMEDEERERLMSQIRSIVNAIVDPSEMEEFDKTPLSELLYALTELEEVPF